MASRKGCGEYDFVEQPPEEYFCPVSLAVLLEPYQTQCCGNHLSQESYKRLQGQPCPVCREENLTANKDKFHKRRVLSLKVRCPHKAEGCEWEGELGSLEQHLSADGECGTVDCPYACGKRIPRNALEIHVKVCNSFQPQEGHELKVIVQKQSKQIKQQAEQIAQLTAQLKQQEDQIRTFSKAVIPPVDIVMDEFRKYKREGGEWHSPPFYTHLGGYKMCLGVYANGHREAKGTHVSVYVCLMRGEFDDYLKWPFCGRVTVYLKDDDTKYRLAIRFNEMAKAGCKPTSEKSKGLGTPDYISHYDIYDYLRNGKLVFCVSNIAVESK